MSVVPLPLKSAMRCDAGDIADDTLVAIQIGDNLLIQKVIDEECDIVARRGARAVAVDDSVTIRVAPNDVGGDVVIVYGQVDFSVVLAVGIYSTIVSGNKETEVIQLSGKEAATAREVGTEDDFQIGAGGRGCSSEVRRISQRASTRRALRSRYKPAERELKVRC